MIISASVAVHNVIKHKEEFSKLINNVCKEIERRAYEEDYAATITVDSQDEDMIDDMVRFLKNELGYKVAVSDCNVLHISWYELDVKHVERDDYLAAEAAYSTADAVYLTAEGACRIVRECGKSYDQICADISECIEDYSKSGRGYCHYNVNNVSNSVIHDVRNALLDAGYDVKYCDYNFLIKWMNEE